MTYDKTAKTPEIVRKVNAYREDRWECHNIGMYDGRFTPDTDEETVTKAFIAERMKNAAPERKTPAMRHGIEAFVRRKTGKADAPDLHRVIYRPWLYAGTKVGARLDSSWGRRAVRKTQTTTLVPAVTEPTSGV
ncbi:hypothetical protein [Palleronia rufa]|uniref:hypothetical protein n=1 Tax=Palleronia rufa TaxID=1530186 RepID=UPI000563ED6A|nr:hypothetical protein [Palleronia rufa]